MTDATELALALREPDVYPPSACPDWHARNLAMDVVDLWRLWHGEPIRYQTWRERLMREAKEPAARRQWERLKNRLRARGYAHDLVLEDGHGCQSGMPTTALSLRLRVAAVVLADMVLDYAEEEQERARELRERRAG